MTIPILGRVDDQGVLLLRQILKKMEVGEITGVGVVHQSENGDIGASFSLGHASPVALIGATTLLQRQLVDQCMTNKRRGV